jgi:hypothetical protein
MGKQAKLPFPVYFLTDVWSSVKDVACYAHITMTPGVARGFLGVMDIIRDNKSEDLPISGIDVRDYSATFLEFGSELIALPEADAAISKMEEEGIESMRVSFDIDMNKPYVARVSTYNAHVSVWGVSWRGGLKHTNITLESEAISKDELIDVATLGATSGGKKN